MKNKSVAIITIKEAARMSKHGRERIAAWLERQAENLRSSGTNLGKRFTARYIYVALIGACLICAPLFFTGCASAPRTTEARVFDTYKSTYAAARAAYKAVVRLHVEKKLSDENRKKADAAWVQFNASFMIAFGAGTTDWSTAAPEQVQNLANQFLNLLKSL